MRTELNRISQIIQLAHSADDSNRVVYDLFCDHGKVGMELLKKGHRVFFNDQVPHLVEEIRNKIEQRFIEDRGIDHSHSYQFLIEDARKLSFEENSLVICSGVGGLLLKECLKLWKERHPEKHYRSLQFILCPSYYDLELRHYLMTSGYTQVEEILCRDRSRFYDIQKVEFKGPKESIEMISRPKNEAFLDEFYKNRLTMLERKRVLSTWEQSLVDQFKSLLLM